MTAPRPFVPRIVVGVPAFALTDLAAWARRWAEAGADGLALTGDPGDAAMAGLIGALRAATQLPLEVVTPAATAPRADWAAPLAGGEVDWLLPGRPPEPEVAEALATADVPWAWPLAAGPVPADSRRVHARNAAETDAWRHVPETAERSLGLDAAGPTAPPMAGVDTLVVPGERLEADSDAAAQLARWRS